MNFMTLGAITNLQDCEKDNRVSKQASKRQNSNQAVNIKIEID